MPGKAIDEERIKNVLMNLDGWDTPITNSRVKRKNIIQNAHAKHYRDLYFTKAVDSEINEAEEERDDV
jgi:hypothetical protein